MRHTRIGFCAILAVASLAAAQTPASNAAAEDKVLAELTSGDDSRIAEAVKSLKNLMATEPRGEDSAGWGVFDANVRKLGGTWIPALDKAGRHREAAELCLSGMTAGSMSRHVKTFIRQRALSLLAAGEYEHALAAARMYYYACPMEQSVDAITLLDQCFKEGRRMEETASHDLRLQQMDGATTRPYAALAPEAIVKAGPTTRPENILTSIDRDLEAEDFIDEWVLRREGANDPYTTMKRGTLQLLLGRAVDARREFENVAKILSERKPSASATDLMAEALDGVARSMKVEDGTVGRANAFLLKLQETPAAQ